MIEPNYSVKVAKQIKRRQSSMLSIFEDTVKLCRSDWYLLKICFPNRFFPVILFLFFFQFFIIHICSQGWSDGESNADLWGGGYCYWNNLFFLRSIYVLRSSLWLLRFYFLRFRATLKPTLALLVLIRDIIQVFIQVQLFLEPIAKQFNFRLEDWVAINLRLIRQKLVLVLLLILINDS